MDTKTGEAHKEDKLRGPGCVGENWRVSHGWELKSEEGEFRGVSIGS